MQRQFIEFQNREKLISDQDEPFFTLKSAYSTFYEHHNMPWRKVIKQKIKVRQQQLLKNRTSQGSRSKKERRSYSNNKSAQKNYPNQQQHTKYQNLLNSRKKNLLSKDTINYGRNIFKKQIQMNKNLGPGQYELSFHRSKSFGYIHHQQFKSGTPQPIKLKLKKQAMLGPGKYSYEDSIQKLSNHKLIKGPLISNSNLIRTIVPTKSVDNIYLNLNLAQKIQKGNYKIGPGAYFNQNNQFSTSQYKKASSYQISNTKRSNIIKSDKKNLVPGPGFYEWNKFYDRQSWKTAGNKRKSAIQFKFIYGHPS